MARRGDDVQLRLTASRWRNADYLWREARPVVQVVFLFRFLVGGAVGWAAGGELGVSMIAAAVAWVAVVFSIYLGNGLSDVGGDVANGSDRPLAAGQLRPQLARRVAIGCLAVGLASAGVARSAVLLGLTITMVAVGWLYSYGPRPLKNHSLAAALTFVAGGLLTYLAGAVSTGVLPTADAFAMIALLSVWMGVGGTSKDLADIAGDRLAGRRTLPVRLGARSAARLVGIGCLAVSVCGCGLAASGSRHWLPALVLSGGALIAALQLQQSSPTGDRARARSPYRTFMCVQYLANASFLVSCTLGSAL